MRKLGLLLILCVRACGKSFAFVDSMKICMQMNLYKIQALLTKYW